MKRLALALLLTVTALSVFAAPAARIKIVKRARENPTISFAASGVDPALAREVGNFLSVCGWFDPVRDKGEYTLALRGEGGGIVAELRVGGAPVGAWRFSQAGTSRDMAKLIVDTLIEKSFRELKVRGFCRSRIAFCAETAPGVRNIYLCDIDGGNVRQLTNYRSLCVEPCWNPNGRSVFYSKYGRAGMDVLETTVGDRVMTRVISGFRGINAGAAVSPDGKKMAVILSPDHLVDLYVLDIGSRRLVSRLTKGLPVEASPCWSPDGRRIAYVSDQSGSPRIWVVNTNGGGRTRLPTVGADAVTPDWSGDDRIVFASRVGGNYTLGVYDFRTGKSTRVTNEPGSWESPAWAADNRQVVCKRTYRGKSGLFVVDTFTGRARELLITSYPLSMPAWSPCAPRR